MTTSVVTLFSKKNYALIDEALLLWTAARTIEGGWRFCEPELLNLARHANGQVSLSDSPYIDYQFSAVVVQDILLPLRKRVLKQLYELMSSGSKENWFTILLVSFTLLSTFGPLFRQQRQFAKMKNAEVSRTANSNGME